MPKGLNISDGQIDLCDGDRAFQLRVAHLDLPSGQAVALTGASGSGKTLLLELLGLLRAPGAETRYYWNNPDRKDLIQLWANGPRSAALARMRGKLFGFVPQSGGLMPFLTVAENIALPQRLNGCEDDIWCRELAERLGLRDVETLMPGALSIGQRQRTAIARALAHRPPFIIADEPTAALDSETADVVLELLLETAQEQGSGVILSSHDVNRIDRFNIPRLSLSTCIDESGLIVSALETRQC